MSVPEAVRVIQDAIARGNYGRADLLCRRTMEALPEFAWARLLLAETALKIGEIEKGQAFCAETAALLANYPDQATPDVRTALDKVSDALENHEPVGKSGGYLLIKCWGYTKER